MDGWKWSLSWGLLGECLPIVLSMLGCSNSQTTPVIGCNVIENIIKSNDVNIVDNLRHALPFNSAKSCSIVCYSGKRKMMLRKFLMLRWALIT